MKNKVSNTLYMLRNIWIYIKSKRKIQLIFLLILMLCTGISEIISLKAIVLFLNTITNTSDVLNNSLVLKASKLFYLESNRDIQLLATIIFCLLIVVTSVLRIGTLWASEILAAHIGNDLSLRTLSMSLNRSYENHLSNNSNKLIATLINYIDDLVRVIKLTLKSITYLFITLSVIIGLISINAKVCFTIISLIGCIYLLLNLYTKKVIERNGIIIANATELQTKYIQESYGSMRDIIIDKKQFIYEKMYYSEDRVKRRSQAANSFIAAFPKFMIEGLGLLIMSLLAFWKTSADGRTTDIALIGSFAFGAQKLLPSLQNVYLSLSRIRSYKASVNNVIDILEEKQGKTTNNKSKYNKKIENIDIKLNDVYYRYKEKGKWNLEKINFIITKGDHLGIIGKSGSGKSTLIDILIGLIKPDLGKIYINGIDTNSVDGIKEISKLHMTTSYVPQNVFISNDEIYKNIAFGIEERKIDRNKVIKAAKRADIHSDILNSEHGYNTIVGERGIKLSGGQIQRIGIARALYKEPNLLILDEATSSVDIKTEKNILKSINQLNKKITIITVAHRLNTVSICNKIIEIEEGALIKQYNKEQINQMIRSINSEGE